jgi:hypothetical protein
MTLDHSAEGRFKLISGRFLPNQRIITLLNDSGIVFQNLLKTQFKLLVHPTFRHPCKSPDGLMWR